MPEEPDDRSAAVEPEPWSVLSALPVGVVVDDGTGTVRWCNPRAAELVGMAPGDVVGRSLTEVAEIGLRAGCVSEPLPGQPRAVVLRPEREADAERFELLATASEELAGSLNLDRTLARIVDLAIPRLADGCMLSFVEGRRLLRVGARRVDGRTVRWTESDVPARRAVPSTVRVRALGRSELVEALDPAHVDQYVPPGAPWEPLRGMPPRSVMVVPLRGREALLGALVLMGDPDRPAYGERDVVAAEGLALRAAVAIDNSLLYRDRSTVARVLQESLLPASLPDVPQLELGVRHRPSSRGGEIGGDFYDVFPAGEGSWAVVVGDVCGKGVEAATLTGLARHTLRAVARHLAEPADVLAALNDAVVQQRGGSTYCTVALARVVPTRSGVDVTVATGGHPPAQVLRADGTVVDVATTGTLLGMLPDVRFRTADLSLGPGDSLVLYTDGIVEARAGARELGPAGLRRVLAESAGLDADTIADRLVQAAADFGGGAQSDDIAVVVARVREPRP